MAEIIDLRSRKFLEDKERQKNVHRRSAVVARILIYTFCPRRCSYCKQNIDKFQSSTFLIPYPLCQECLEEYQAFCRREIGQLAPEAFWHTEEWAEMWRSWLKYMRASDKFRHSGVFLRLLENCHQD